MDYYVNAYYNIQSAGDTIIDIAIAGLTCTHTHGSRICLPVMRIKMLVQNRDTIIIIVSSLCHA